VGGISGQVIELFNPGEPRDAHGRWAKAAGPGGGMPIAKVGDKVMLPDGKNGTIKGIGPPAVPLGAVYVVVPGAGGRVYQAHELGLAAPVQSVPEQWEFIGPHGSGMGAAFLPGNREPQIGDMARNGHGGWGRVVNKHGGHAVIDADDGQRHLVDWRNGGAERHAAPLSKVPPPRNDLLGSPVPAAAGTGR
jgi:hypothetical protein